MRGLMSETLTCDALRCDLVDVTNLNVCREKGCDTQVSVQHDQEPSLRPTYLFTYHRIEQHRRCERGHTHRKHDSSPSPGHFKDHHKWQQPDDEERNVAPCGQQLVA